jgi:hypothetical protein
VKSAPARKNVAYSGYVIPKTGELIMTKPEWFNYETVIAFHALNAAVTQQPCELLAGKAIQLGNPLFLRHSLTDVQNVDVFEVCQNKQLLYRGVVAHIAVFIGISSSRTQRQYLCGRTSRRREKDYLRKIAVFWIVRDAFRLWYYPTPAGHFYLAVTSS